MYVNSFAVVDGRMPAENRLEEYEPGTRFGQWLRDTLIARGMSGVRQSGGYLKVNPSLINSYLLGRTHPSPKTARKIARSLGAEESAVLDMLPSFAEGATPTGKNVTLTSPELSITMHIPPGGVGPREIEELGRLLIESERVLKERRVKYGSGGEHPGI